MIDIIMTLMLIFSITMVSNINLKQKQKLEDKIDNAIIAINHFDKLDKFKKNEYEK